MKTVLENLYIQKENIKREQDRMIKFQKELAINTMKTNEEIENLEQELTDIDEAISVLRANQK